MRKMIGLLVALVFVVAAWTGGWFWLRGVLFEEMDRQLAALAADGVVVACPDRSGTGWPFRMEIACDGPSLGLPDGRMIRAGAAAATLHVTDPRLVVFALAEPVTVAGGPAEVRSGFDSLRASVRMEGERLGRVSLEARGADLAIDPAAAADGAGPATLAADRIEIHLRPKPGMEDAFELSSTVIALSGEAGGEAILPAPANLGLAAAMSEASLLDGTPDGLRAWAAAGGEVTVAEAVIEVGATRIVADGAGTVKPDGSASARLDAVATDVAWLTEAAKSGSPLPPALAALGSAFMLLGKPVDGEGAPRSLAITVEDGAAKANGLALGAVPPLF